MKIDIIFEETVFPILNLVKQNKDKRELEILYRTIINGLILTDGYCEFRDLNKEIIAENYELFEFMLDTSDIYPEIKKLVYEEKTDHLDKLIYDYILNKRLDCAGYLTGEITACELMLELIILNVKIYTIYIKLTQF